MGKKKATKPSNTMNEPEPVVEAVEFYANDIYKIKYIECSAGFDHEEQEPYMMTKKVIKIFEVTEQPITAYDGDDTEWSDHNPSRSINYNTGCCSKMFVEWVESRIKNNKTEFPTTIKVHDDFWIILEVSKIN